MASLRSGFAVCAVFVALGIGPAAYAQETPPATSPAPATAVEPGSEVEEIRVTITKREESVQEIGGAVAAFGKEQIEEANIENVGDLIALLPNVQVKSENTDLSIRGVARAAFDSQSPVAYHVNGIYHYNSLSYAGQFYDLEGIEVALGPSGTLYGRNANGGAINLRWRKPTSQYEVHADTTYAGPYDAFQFRSAVNIPLSGEDNDLLNARVVFTREVSDGPLVNEQDTHRHSFGYDDDWNARVFFMSQPTDNLNLQVRAHYHKSDGNAAGGINLLPSDWKCPPVGTQCGHPIGVLPFPATPTSPAVNLPFDWADGMPQFKGALLSNPQLAFLAGVNQGVQGFPTLDDSMEDILLNGFLGFPLSCNPAVPFPAGCLIPPIPQLNLVRSPEFFTPILPYPSSDLRTNSRIQQLGPGFMEIWGLDGSVEYTVENLPLLGEVDLYFGAGYERIENEGLSESDASELTALDTESSQLPEEMTTFELRAQSNNDTWLNWTLGFFLVRNTVDQVRNTLTPLTVSGATLEQKDYGYAPFANVVLTPIDEIEIFLGARWNHDEFERHEVSNPTPLTASTDFRGGETFRETTLDAQIKWFVTENHMVYAKWARGYKAGFIQLLPDPAGGTTPNDPNDDFQINDVKPEVIIATEIGAKTSWFDGRLIANWNAFHYDYTNLQVPVIKVVQIVNVNAEEATVWGSELGLELRPVDAWTSRAAIGWLKAEFDEFCSDEPLSPVYGPNPVAPVDPGCQGSTAGGQDLSGNTMEDAPEWKVSLMSSYHWEIGSFGSITPTLEFTWTDSAWRRPQNNPAVDRVDSYTKTDVRVRWEEPENRFWLELFGENLEDNHVYPRGIVVALTGTAQGFGLLQPRTYGVRLGFDWGSGN